VKQNRGARPTKFRATTPATEGSTAAGWQVLRFPGSEVYRDPAGCARGSEDVRAETDC
jgi:hypothetical protein